MFGRKKRFQDDYEEYDYEEEYEDYENGYEEDYEEDVDQEIYPSQRKEKLEKVNEELMQEIGYLKNKIHILEVTQPMEEDKSLKQEVKTLNQHMNRLQQEVKAKQEEVEKLSGQLLDSGEESEEVQVLENKLGNIQEELRSEKKQVKALKEQIDAESGMRINIADVMIEAKETSQKIVRRAEYEAQKLMDTANIKASRMISEAQVELGIIQKEASDYYQKVSYTREETVTLFDQLLEKLVVVKG